MRIQLLMTDKPTSSPEGHKLGVSKDIATDGQREKPNDGFLSLLKIEFWTPFLSLIKEYLVALNGAKKTPENCLSEFKQKHERLFLFILFLDFLLRILYLLVVLFVVLRGLGIIGFLENVIGRFS